MKGMVGTMGYDKIYEELITLNEAERLMQEYYIRNNTFYPMENVPFILAGMDLLGYGINNTNHHALLQELLNPSAAVELKEEDYFISEYDILILKNLRYTQVPNHQHTFFEMMFILTGTCTNIIDNHENIMSAGDLCIIPPRVPHSIQVTTDSVLINILIRTSTFTETFIPLLRHTNILSDFFNEILYAHNYKKYLLFHLGNDLLLRDLILEMYEEQQERKAYYASILNGLLISFFGKLLQRHEGNVEYPSSYVEKYDIVPRISKYMEENCKRVTLNSCAEQFHFNPQYLSALLKKHTGKTFSELLKEMRMKEAVKLLRQSNLTVNEISIVLGYEDSAYFMKVFKKYYGSTPSNYRKGMKKSF